MKIKVYKSSFKKCCDRAMAIINKMPIPAAMTVTIDAKEQTNFAILRTNSYEDGRWSTLEIVLDAEIIDPGEAMIDVDDLKKIYDIKSDSIIEIEGSVVTVKNAKKKSSVSAFCGDPIQPIKVDIDKSVAFYSENEVDFVKMLTTFKKFAPSDDNNKVMKTVCFNTDMESIFVLDGHRITWKKSEWFVNSQKMGNILIPAFICDKIKKIVGKADYYKFVELSIHDGKVLFSGNDFSYTVQCVEGTYFDVSRMIFTDRDGLITIDEDVLEEMIPAVKEYEKLCLGSKTKKPMYMVEKNSVLYFGVMLPDYKSYDVAELTEDSGSFIFGFNPSFIREALEIFGDKICISYTKSGLPNKSPIVISDENEHGWNCLILPVYISSVDMANFVNYTA